MKEKMTEKHKGVDINTDCGTVNFNPNAIYTDSPEETALLGYKLGKKLDKGDVICLTGDLGAGKTAFTAGIAKALGIDEYITSPTFAIVHEYYGDKPLYHFDVYRIGDSEKMYDTGYEEYINGDGVVVIEWANLIEDILPLQYLQVDIRQDPGKGPDKRIITFRPKGDKFKIFHDILK